jgi:NADH-quinone oxidoreductase subunit N
VSGDLLRLMAPEILLTVAALGLMLWDLWLPKEKKGVLGWAAMAVCVVLFAVTFVPDVAKGGEGLGDPATFVVDPLALFFKRAFCVAAFLVFLMSREYVDDLPQGQGEFNVLCLLALLGMFLCASVNDFMSLFVSLEVVTVSFFVLAAFRREKAASVEAGLKLLVIGSLSAAILLYGIAFVYGAVGDVSFSAVRRHVAQGGVESELILGAVMIFLGLGFKTSAVPLHVWVPDVYQGAPTPVTAFLSVGSKLAGFVLVVRALTVFAGPGSHIVPMLTAFFTLVAALTLVYGNLGAIPQTNVKRLLGYSSIAQCGYILVGVAAASAVRFGGSTTGLSGALFYMAAYVVTNLAAFAVILVVARVVGSHEIDDYAGLAKRSPLLGAALTCALLSLAGVPPFIGFFGKFMLLGSAFDLSHPELLWCGAIGLVTVVIALYYYLCLVKSVYVHEPRSLEPIAVPTRMKVTLALAMAALIVGGVAPQFLERSATNVAKSLATAAAAGR